MVAMYANGLSVWRMVRPAVFAAACISGVNFIIFDQLVPLSNARFAQLRRDVGGKTPTLAFKPQILNAIPPGNARFYLRARNIEPVGGRLSDVLIYDLTYEARRVIRADSGTMKQSPDGRDLLLTLHDGEIRDYRSMEPGRVERTAFGNDRIRIRDVANQLERREVTGSDERSMTSCQLLDRVIESRYDYRDGVTRREEYTRRDLRSLAELPPLPPSAVRLPPRMEADCGPYRDVQRWIEKALLPAELAAQDPVKPKRDSTAQDPARPKPDSAQQRQDSAPRKPVDSAALAVPTDAARQDSLIAQGDSLAGISPLPPTFADSGFLVPPVGAAQLAPANGIVSPIVEVSGARMQSDNALAIMRSHSVEYHKKFAIPLACVGFVLVGMSLALKYPRGGIGLVIGGSLVIFMLFYVLLIGGEGLADKGYIHPVVAMHGPVVLLTLIGLASVASANREMGTARSAGLFESLRNIFRRADRT
jgi:lipopolysaccharide export system permease protein